MYIICRMEAARKWTRNYIVYSSNAVRTIYSAQQKAFNGYTHHHTLLGYFRDVFPYRYLWCVWPACLKYIHRPMCVCTVGDSSVSVGHQGFVVVILLLYTLFDWCCMVLRAARLTAVFLSILKKIWSSAEKLGRPWPNWNVDNFRPNRHFFVVSTRVVHTHHSTLEHQQPHERAWKREESVYVLRRHWRFWDRLY